MGLLIWESGLAKTLGNTQCRTVRCKQGREVIGIGIGKEEPPASEAPELCRRLTATADTQGTR